MLRGTHGYQLACFQPLSAALNHGAPLRAHYNGADYSTMALLP